MAQTNLRFSWISLLNVRSNDVLRAFGYAVLVLLVSISPAGAGQSKTVPSRDVVKFLPLIAELVLKQEPFPRDAKVSIELTGGEASEVHMGDELRVVVPVRIRFDGISNSYCRLAVIDQGRSLAELVPLPVNADHDDCEGMRKMAAVDLNYDGIPDLVFQVDIPSNRYPVMVSEGAVYLSKPNDGKTYCFAPDASVVVGSDAPTQADKVRAIIETEVARRGKQVLDCFSAGHAEKAVK